MARFQGYQDDPAQHTLDLSYLRRLWPFARPYRGAFATALLILAVSFVLEITGPYLLKLAVDGPITDVARGRDPDVDVVAWLGLAYLAVTVIAVALGYAYAMTTARAGQKVIRDVRVHLFDHILRLGPRFFDHNPAGKLVTRTTTDVENLSELISTGVLQTVFDLMKIFGILGVLLVLAPDLALVTLIATPALVVISLVFRGYVRRSYRKGRGRLARQNAFVAEAIGGMRVTRMFRCEDAVEGHYSELNQDTREAWTETVTHFAGFYSLVDACLRVTQVSVLFVGGMAIIEGTTTPGVFVMFWLCYGKLTEPIRELGEKYNVLQSAFASSERIFGILEQPTATPSPAQPVAPPRGPAQLRFEDVSFSYVDGTPVLRGVDLEVNPGETVALVGPTGAGKTTILALISRLYDPDRGRVTLDGVDVREQDVYSLRGRIAVVPQDVFLFTGTVLDNLRLFDDSIPTDRVTAALATIGALDFVESLDGGLQAEVQERGATFSQGERQLLAFARALVMDPDLLVLDEATANIDNESEEVIHRGLRRLLEGRTAIIVAHRLATVRDADRILVVQDGQIAENGDHQGLMRRGGIYAKMARLA